MQEQPQYKKVGLSNGIQGRPDQPNQYSDMTPDSPDKSNIQGSSFANAEIGESF
jgi:hypothetical protein